MHKSMGYLRKPLLILNFKGVTTQEQNKVLPKLTGLIDYIKNKRGLMFSSALFFISLLNYFFAEPPKV